MTKRKEKNYLVLVVPDQKVATSASLMQWLKVVEMRQLSTGTAGDAYLHSLKHSSQ
jgi:hypothetical protein